MITAIGSSSSNRFIVDIMQKIRSRYSIVDIDCNPILFSDLEKSLMLLPFGYVCDILHALSACVREQYKVELASRVIMFLTR